MSNLSKKIQDSIKDHLPEAVAGEMKEFISQAKEIEKEFKILSKNHEKLEKVMADRAIQSLKKDDEIDSLNRKIEDLEFKINKCEDCDRRYSEITHKEAIISIKEGHCHDRIQDMKDLTAIVFKSPVYRKSVTTSKETPVKTADNMGQGGEYLQQNTETKETSTSED